MLEAGAKRALKLKVGGAFHSPLMQPAHDELAKAINEANFHTPMCPVYQNVDALPHTDPTEIKNNLIDSSCKMDANNTKHGQGWPDRSCGTRPRSCATRFG